ncbi:hypothetical protein [Nocardioides flavescens]|uniref:4-amino-4-deoxy-L-arabinose transferase n=1 Tax=Nocardioides flavescens TaxID=2691959 RepID=A0A6L7ERS4_9ACTN|nr:hypothetical protein [Nocardioides flavescens]MXG89380.1 hypothetical protein [Nocardioides flavescens]
MPRRPPSLVAGLAAAAFVVRLVGLTRPVRADEAGFTLVARAWDPSPGSVFGPYFVDRPPSLVALFGTADALAGPLAVRVLGAVACAVVVLLAWRLAVELDRPGAAPWVAAAAAALVVTPAIDVVAVKGEVLALPFVLAAAVLAVRLARERTRHPWPVAVLTGLLAAAPLGLKQNLAGALVLVGVLLLATPRTRRLLPAVALGAAVPVLATIAWALVAGVRLSVLWYAVYGFRADASAALAEGSAAAPARRALVLLLIVVVTGLGAALAAYAVTLRGQWRHDAPLTGAVVAMVIFDVASLVAGGSFWQDYAFGLVPGALLALVLVGARARRAVASLAVASSLVCLAGWGVWNLAGRQEFSERDTGVALAAVAEPGDTLVVFGGRADVQLESGLASPYPYLWSLPMRALDPDLVELRTLVAGPDAPTWLVEWWDFDTWDHAAGDALRADVERRYVRAGTACDGRPVWLLRGEDRATPEPACTS